MKSRTFEGRLLADDVDLLVAKLGVLTAVLLFGLRLFAAQPFLLVIPAAIGSGSGLYLLAGRGQSAESVALGVPRLVVGYLPAVVLGGLALIVFATHLAGSRTATVYLLTGGVGGVIFGQILLVDDDLVAPGAILFEILAAAVVIRLSALFVTPGYVGVDIWTHALVYVDGLVATGSLEALAGSKYVMAPFYHVVAATGALVFGTVRTGIYLTLGLAVPLSVLFVYATGQLLYLPTRWALLAAALWAFADQVIRWGIHVIPTSLGLALFAALVYAVTRVFTADAEPWAVGVALLVSLGVVFTHQVSTVVALVFLGVATTVAVGSWLATEQPPGSQDARKAVALVGVSTVTLAVTLLSWARTPFGGEETFLWREIAVVLSAFTESGFLNLARDGGATVGGPGGGPYAWLIPYVELFGFTLLLAAAVVGGLVFLRYHAAPDVAITFVLAASAMFVVVFGLSLIGVRALLPGRWLAFMFAPFALLAAAGLYHLSRSESRTLVVALFVVLAVGYPASMVVAEKATLDSPAFGDQHARYSYTAAELGAAHTISEVHPAAEGDVFRTDHPYSELFEVIGGYEDGSLVLGPGGPVAADTTVARDYQETGPIGFDRSPEAPASAVLSVTDVCPGTWNVLYANDQVRLCTAGAGGGA